MPSFDKCYASVIREEGGYVNNPRDPGGMTNLGVTRRAWDAWVGHRVEEADMRALTPKIVEPFYRANYWNPVHGDELPPALALCLFHCAVNTGPKRAAKLLQGMVGALADGAIGPGTMAAVTVWVCAHDLGAAVTGFQNALRSYYRTLPTFQTFGKGWLNRAAAVEKEAKGMIND